MTLAAKTAAETTVQAVRADGDVMVTDYGVYLLVVLRVHLAAAPAIAPVPDAAGISAAVRSVHDAAKDVRGDLGKAVADAKKVRHALK